MRDLLSVSFARGYESHAASLAQDLDGPGLPVMPHPAFAES